MSGTLFVVCTRNRPRQFARLLEDVDTLFHAEGYSILAIDDSTDDAARMLTRGVFDACEHGLYIGNAERRRLMRQLARSYPQMVALRGYAATLGTRRWNLAKARYLAVLFVLFDTALSKHQRICFLDDDIRLLSCRYRGLRLDVDTPGVRDAVTGDNGREGALWARGASYVGRADTCQLTHLEGYLKQLGRLGGPAGRIRVIGNELFVETLCATRPFNLRDHGPGISGAFLVTNRRTLSEVLLPQCYNEDWIWLRLVEAAGGSLRRGKAPVVHAGDKWLRVDLTKIKYQLIGDLIYLAIVNARRSGSGLDKSMSEEMLRSSWIELSAWLSHIQDLCDNFGKRAKSPTVGVVEKLSAIADELRRMSRLFDSELLPFSRQFLRQHFEHARLWRETVPQTS
jgi:hypothetical protein